MNNILISASGFALGAATMYFLDPVSARRRRALTRDKLVRAVHDAERGIDITSRDLKHRAFGTFAGLKSRFSSTDTPEQKLVARVRSALGRVVSHPHAVHVRARGGTVILEGQILTDEVDHLIKTVCAVKGVDNVENRLEVHRTSSNIPALQGHGRAPGYKFDIMQANWSPTTRLAVGASGVALISQTVVRPGPLRLGMGGVGGILLARAFTNLELAQFFGFSPVRRGFNIEKTININAPVNKVFDFFSDYANFPHFMRHVRRVTGDETGVSHWLIDGPAGVTCSWDAELTRYEPYEAIAWKTVDKSIIKHAGLITFHDNGDSSTQVHIRLTYNPPAGYMGHLFAKILGSNPKAAGRRHASCQIVLRDGSSGPRRGPTSEWWGSGS